MKFSKSLILTGLIIFFPYSLHAAPSSDLSPTLKQQMQLKENFSSSSKSNYAAYVQVVDSYGNILGIDTKWHNSTSIQNSWITNTAKAPYTMTIDITRPYYYTPLSASIPVTDQKKLTTLTMEPSKVVNTLSGKVIFPTHSPTDSLYLQITPKDKIKNQDAVLKVEVDGSFKIHNLIDGEYIISPLIGKPTIISDVFSWTTQTHFTPQTFTIKGDTQLTLDLTNSEYPSLDAVYFQDITRTNPMIYVHHTPSSTPPQFLKDLALPIHQKSALTDYEKVLEVLKAMNSSQIAQHGTIRNKTLFDIIKDGKIYYESCGDYANVFVSLCRELGLPAVYAQAASIGLDYSDVQQWLNKEIPFAEAHQNVEVYLPDQKKWILVEPHFCDIITQYDPANPYVAYSGKAVNLPKDGLYYFYIKSANNTFKKPHEFVLSHIDPTLPYTAQTYDVDLNYHK